MGEEGDASEIEREMAALRARLRQLEVRSGERPPEPEGLPPLELLLEHAPDSITVIDLRRRLIYVNRAPRGTAAVLGRSVHEFIPEAQRALFDQAFERAVQGRLAERIELRTQTERVFETRLVPLIRGEEVLAVMGIGADVTQQRQAEDALRQAQKLEAIGLVTAGIAHNFNNMLMVLLTNLQLCEQRAPDELKPRLSEALGAAQRAAETVRELMVFARKPERSVYEFVDLREIAERALAICRSGIEPSIELRFSAEEGLVPLRLHARRIEQALVNLLFNARDALEDQLEPKGVISVAIDTLETCIEEGGAVAPAVRLRVSDNGPGMQESVRRRIFEPFFTTKRGSRGTGLGLASVYGAMLDHDGIVTCESRPGAGSTFTLLFPVFDPSAEATKDRA